MKNILLFILLLASAGIYAQGIQFTQADWENAFVQAKKQNKMVFVDAYTTWCGPCKMMSRDVFPNPAVGKFYNENFINVKLNMEKGVGPNVAQQFNVTAYPTYLFLSPDGELVHRNMGYLPAPTFLELGEAAKDPKRQSAKLAARFAAGDRSPELLRNYAMASYENDDRKYVMLAMKYLDTQEDWSTIHNMEFLMKYADNFDDQPMQYLLQNREKFSQTFGHDVVDGHIQKSIRKKLYGGGGQPLTLQEVDATYQKTFPEEAERLGMEFRINYYERAQDLDQFTQAVVNYLDKYANDNWQDLNAYAWAFYENVEDPKLLQKALGWAVQSVSIEESFYNTDTAAALYYKLGKQAQARKYAKQAIELAKAAGQDPQPTVDLLQKINEM